MRVKIIVQKQSNSIWNIHNKYFLHAAARLCVTPQTAAHQAPLSLGFSRQEYWSRLTCPPPGDLPDLEIKPTSPVAPASQ